MISKDQKRIATRHLQSALKALNKDPAERGTMIRTLIQLPADKLAEVDQAARRMGMSRSTWLRFVALRALEEGNR